MVEIQEHNSRKVVGSFVGKSRAQQQKRSWKLRWKPQSVAAGAQQEVIFESQGRSNNKREDMLERRERSGNIRIRNQQDGCVVESQERSSKNIVRSFVGRPRAQQQERSWKLRWKPQSVAAGTYQEVIFESQERSNNKGEVMLESQERSSKNVVGSND